jgi:hypothetical protein
MDAELVLRRLKARTRFAGRVFTSARLSAFSYNNFSAGAGSIRVEHHATNESGDCIYSQGLRLQSGAS